MRRAELRYAAFLCSSVKQNISPASIIKQGCFNKIFFRITYS